VVARQPKSPAQQASEQAQQASQQAQQASQQAGQASQQARQASLEAQQASQQSDAAMAQANAAMDEAKLASLRVVAVGHINLAYTAYVSACRDIRDSIKAAAKQNAELMALVLDVAMGFATPGLSRWVVGFANRIPVDSSTIAYRAAMAALDGDRVKAVLTGATRTAGYLLKSHSMELAGETDADKFIGDLETDTQEAFQTLIDSLPGLDAVHVGTLIAAFDFSVANRNVYRRDIKRLTDMFEREVAPIGTTPLTLSEAGPATLSPEAVWVKDGAAKRLALVRYRPGFLGTTWGSSYDLDSWVHPEMEKLVLKKQLDTYGSVDTIAKDDVREYH
jgi:hypothetical protein